MILKKSASVPVVLPVTCFNARTTVPSPELYAAAARYHEPSRSCRLDKYLIAASVERAGFFRSSTFLPTARPYCFAVGFMNCHMPTAFTFDFAFGLKPDSIIAR